MKVSAFVLFLLLLSCCKPHFRGGRYVGMDRAAAVCSRDRTGYAVPVTYRQTCISAGHVYTCISEGDNVWMCAPATTPLSMEKTE